MRASFHGLLRWNRTAVWAAAIVGLAIVAVRSQAAEAAGQRPNIVVILADDLGYGDVQCNNPQRGKIPTPNIDRLAAQGMRFTDGHSSSGVCSPSRYTLLTGRYHWRTRLQSGIVGVFGAPLIAPDRLTVAGLLQQQGYRTGCVGKWHLGWDWPIPPEQETLFRAKPQDDSVTPPEDQKQLWSQVFSQPIAGGPTTRGFGSYFGTDVPNWPPYCFIENDRTIGIPSEFLPARLLKNHQASLPGPALPDWKLEPILPTLGDRACAFIESCARQTEPFFLYMPLTSPHTPLAVNDAWKGKSGLNTYADFVMETDAVVGRVLEAVEKSGAASKTLVVFTSDNGCAPYVGAAELEKMGHFPSGPLRGYKADVWEGGHRVPFIVRWPGVVKAGSVCDQLVQHADLLATCAEIVGANLPDDGGRRQRQPDAAADGRRQTGSRVRRELLGGRLAGDSPRAVEADLRPRFGRLGRRPRQPTRPAVQPGRGPRRDEEPVRGETRGRGRTDRADGARSSARAAARRGRCRRTICR